MSIVGYKYYLTFKYLIILIVKTFVSIYTNISLYSKKNNNKIITPIKKIEDNIVISPTIDELEKRIDTIKNKYEEHELLIRNYEHQIKLIEAFNKQYDYKIKLIETKGKVLSDCLSIIKDVMIDMKSIEN